MAVDATGRDEAERRRAPRHRPDLHRRGVGAQHVPAVDEEGVLHVARRVIGRDVERLEVVPLGLDLGTFLDREAEPGEEADDVALDLRDRVQVAARGATPGSDTSRRRAASA